MTFPTELIREITLNLLGANSLADEQIFTGTRNLKPPWDLINSLSVASKTFRAISMEAWFRKLYLTRIEDLKYIATHWPEVSWWVL
jgi:hypothetical protein